MNSRRVLESCRPRAVIGGTMLRIISKSRRACRAVAALCIFLIFAPSCRQSTLVRSQIPSARNAYRPAAPGSLSAYIRTVLKISAEKGAKVEQQLKQAEAQSPDLTRLAEESSAHPADVEMGLRLAESFVKAGLYFPAYEVYQRLQAAAEPRAEIELGLAGIWDKWQDYSLARTHAEYALQIDAQSHEAWGLLARIHLHRGDFEAAAVSFEKALGLQQSDPILFANAGYAYLRLGRLDQAQAYLEKALSLDGTIAEAHNHLGIVLARQGQYDSALTHFAQTSEPAVALNNLGAVCLDQGKWEEARKFFREALSLKPDYDKALAHLRATETLAPPPARVSVPEGIGIQFPEQQVGVDARDTENGPPPSRVSVSIAIAPALAGTPKPGVSLLLEPAESKTEEVAETGEMFLGKGPYLIQKAAANPSAARPALSENHFYHPTLTSRLRSVAQHFTEPLPPQAPTRRPLPVAPALSRPGASPSVSALRWQEPLLGPTVPAQTSLDWSTSPHSDQSSAFYVPTLGDVLLTGFFAIAVFLGLLLAGGAGALISVAAVVLAIVGRLVQ